MATTFQDSPENRADDAWSDSDTDYHRAGKRHRLSREESVERAQAKRRPHSPLKQAKLGEALAQIDAAFPHLSRSHFWAEGSTICSARSRLSISEAQAQLELYSKDAVTVARDDLARSYTDLITSLVPAIRAARQSHMQELAA